MVAFPEHTLSQIISFITEGLILVPEVEASNIITISISRLLIDQAIITQFLMIQSWLLPAQAVIPLTVLMAIVCRPIPPVSMRGEILMMVVVILTIGVIRYQLDLEMSERMSSSQLMILLRVLQTFVLLVIDVN